jgi:uncharacterized protein (DUF1501 family)
MTDIDRRCFLEFIGLGAVAAGLPAVHVGGSRGRPVLVVVYLRGGQDALNTLVPAGDDRYHALRPTIAIPREGERAALRIDDTFGLHPSLAPLEPWYRGERCAPIVCVGSPHPTRSHFDAQDFMEFATPGLRTVRAGWLDRYLVRTRGDRDGALRAVAMQGVLPKSLRGDYPVVAVPDASRRTRGTSIIEGIYAGGMHDGADAPPGARADPVRAAGQTTIAALQRYDELMRAAPARAEAARYPQGGLGARLERIARLIRSGDDVEIACADYNGWDHHANEGGVDGALARMLDHLARALAAFATDLGPDLDRTLVLTMTEFGRTCRENGNAGTDHGHGGLMLALGAGVRGGRVVGAWPGLGDRDLWQGRDLPVTTDFRDVMAEALAQHLGFRPPAGFFEGYEPKKAVGLLR